MKKSICHISTVHPVLDDRILFKECNSLKEQGYDVSFIVSNPEKISFPGINILALPEFTSRWQRLFKGSRLVYSLVRKSKAEVIHFHDPELMFVAVALRCSGKKVIYDVHENITQQIRYKPWIQPAFLRWIMSFVIHLLEKFCCLFFNGIVAATDDIARKFPTSKTFVIRNFPLYSWTKDIQIQKLKKKKTIVVYAGGLTPIRGIKEIIDAMALVSYAVELKLIGKFDDIQYEEECKSSSGWTKVNYLGFMPLKEVYKEIALSDIGIAMLYPIRNYLSSLPVKAFEYMAFGLPMILSDFPFWKEMFGGSAFFANPYKAEDIAEKLTKLLIDKTLQQELGNYGKQRIQEELSWEAESNRLFKLYKKVCDEG